jgi:hypothetical protein
VSSRLSLRIFLIHALFTIALGAIAFVIVRDSFQRYYQQWERSVATQPAEQVFEAPGNEIARALLLRIEKQAEVKIRDQDRIVMGLNAILKEIRASGRS